MDPKAVTKAESRLRIAEKARADFASVSSYAEFSDAWYIFLTASKNIYTALEQGAKVSPQSRQWFGAKKQERRQDELLQYLFQSRDDDEHGLEAVTALEPGRVSIGVAKPGFSNAVQFDGTVENMRVTSLDGKPVLIERVPPHVKLIAVHGRGGITYAPPSVHKGRSLTNVSPGHIADLAIAHLAALVAEAKGLS